MDAAENGRPRSLRWPRCEHLKHHLARRCRGIEPLLMQEQIDIARPGAISGGGLGGRQVAIELGGGQH